MKKLYMLIVFLFGMVFLAGCNENTKEVNTTVLQDKSGRNVCVTPGSYKRIVCIGAGALRLYSYVGDVNLLCGVEDIDNESLSERPKMFDGVARPYFIAYKDVFKTLPSCGIGGPANQAAEAEKILSCNPDLIISEYEDVDKANALAEEVGVPVITLSYGSNGVFDSNIKDSISLLGKVLDKEEKATALNDYIAKEKEAISAKVASAVSDKSVYICGLGNWGTTNHLMTAQNYYTFTICKINNVISGLAKNGIQAIEAEKFEAIGNKTDIMIIDSAAVKNIKPLYANDPTLFDSMKAWNSGEVYLEMAYNAYYTNIEISLINTWYSAKIVYPELFSDIDMTDKTNEVTKAFLGKELASEIFAYPNSFGGYQKIDTSTFFN